MLPVIAELKSYSDAMSNVIVYDGAPLSENVSIVFRGNGNRLAVAPDAIITKLAVEFLGSNATVSIGGGGSAGFRIRVGSHSRVTIGREVTSTGPVYMTAFEGSSITFGIDCMIAGNVQLRADDAHPIFDVETGQRTNKAKPIVIGDHVWLGEGSVILGGTEIGNGSVVGIRSVVKAVVTNNCIIAGQPARIVRRNIAWERPYLGYEHLFDPEGNPNGFTKDFWRLSETKRP